MELMPDEVVVLPNASPYHSVPASPIGGGRGITFFTAPSSPAKHVWNDKNDDDLSSTSDDFEFETSQRFDDYIELEIDQNFERFVDDHPQKQLQGAKMKRERGGSLPTMAFADELFYNGQVMPLKPPPRLQYGDESASFGQGSFPPSPKSPQSSVFKVPFVHHRAAAWNDDFDPFKVAMEKVSEESRGRTSNAGSHHRRTRSHSPLRMNNSMDKHFDQQILGPKFGPPKEPKGSPYARFVIDQNKQVEQREKERKKQPPKTLPSGKRIRPLKTDHEGSNKTSSKIEENEGGNTVVVETGRMKRLRSILLKYVSFGKENNDDKARRQSSTKWKSSFKKLSFKIKGHGNGNEKKRGIEEGSKMEVIEYKRSKPSLALCFYGFDSHKNMCHSQ